MTLEEFFWEPSTSSKFPPELHSPSLNDKTPLLMVHDASSHRPSHILVWSLGLVFVTVISLCALVGVIVMRCMKKNVFNKFITFSVSLGVGSLSGSAVFHLLPQAFGLANESASNRSTNQEYLTKSFAAIVGIYLFFFSDKFIKIVLETKKRKKYEVTELSNHDNRNHLEAHKSEHSSDALMGISANKRCASSNSYNGRCKATISNPIEEDSFSRQAHAMCVHDDDIDYKEGDSVIKTVAWMIIFGDGLHNFIDGVSIGVSFSESILRLSGISVSCAVLCEEFPHELGDLAILINAGMTVRQALVYNLLSALSCYIGFAIGVLVGNLNESFTSYTFGFAGGMFLYISLALMMPEMKCAMEEALSVSLAYGLEVLFLQAAGVVCGLFVMAYMSRYGSEIQFDLN